MQDLIKTPWGIGFPSNHLDRQSPLFDPFGKLRVSQPDTLFDSKLSFGKLSQFWDEVISGGTSTHIEVDSCCAMTVDSPGDFVIRQTRQRWNYQPGKGQCLVATFRPSVVVGTICRVGLMHGNYASPHTIHDGAYLELVDGQAFLCITKGTEAGGIVTAQRTAQSAWNMDRLDGTGPSGRTIDWTKAQILMIDYQWLGVGGVRFGFEVDSTMVYVHEFEHAGEVASVYMHNGTQPIRYEIRSTGGTGTMTQICSSVVSEGGAQKTGIPIAVDTNGTLISCPTPAVQMLIAARIDPATPDVQLLLEKVYSLNTANTSYRWVVLFNPTIVGTPNWVTEPGTPVQVWRNAGTNITMSGGLAMDSGYASRDSRQANTNTNPNTNPGVSIAGTPDIVALGVESIGGTSSCSGGMGFRQLV